MASTRHARAPDGLSSPRRKGREALDAESLLPLKGAGSDGLDASGAGGGSSPPPPASPSPSGRTLSPAPGRGGAPPGAVSHLFGLSDRVVAGGAYCVASTAMVLLNKAALSSFGFSAPTALLLFQCSFCGVAAWVVGRAGGGGSDRAATHTRALPGLSLAPAPPPPSAFWGSLEPPSWALMRAWAPVNALFVAMVWTSFAALASLGVPMVTVLKNLTNLFTIAGDFWLFGRTYGRRVWGTLALMGASALCGAATDLAFNARGYGWQLANCAATAAYSLALRGVMDRVAGLTAGRKRLSELSMVFYNNALAVPILLPLCAANGELGRLWRGGEAAALSNPAFLGAAGASAALAFGISFTSLWFLSTTTATAFSLVGSLNKVPIALLGLFAFGAPATPQNIASIGVGLAASAVFVLAKQGPPSAAAKAAGANGGGV